MSEIDKNKEREMYRNYLESLVENNSSNMFYNGGKENAAVLMHVLLENTKKEFRMFCEGFKEELIMSKPYKEAIEKFLKNKDKKVWILVESEDFMNESSWDMLRDILHMDESERAQIEVHHISDSAKNEIKENFLGDHYNFAVFDDQKYRIEYEPSQYKAFGSFNDPEESGNLKDIFDKAFRNSKVITLN